MISFERSGELARDVGGLLGGLRAIQRRVQMNALAAAGHRHRVVSDLTQDVADEPRNPGAGGQFHTWTRIKIKNKAIRVLWLPVGSESPLRHVDF
jgi:hypothetical protein